VCRNAAAAPAIAAAGAVTAAPAAVVAAAALVLPLVLLQLLHVHLLSLSLVLWFVCIHPALVLSSVCGTSPPEPIKVQLAF
jgi:hypothetical protein